MSIKRVLWPTLIVALCLAASGCGRTESYCGIEVRGSYKFVAQVQSALAAIQRAAPEDFELIATYVRRVEEHSRSGMDAGQDMPTCQLAPASAYYSVTWCAGCIAHESCHARLGQAAAYEYGEAKEERECIAYQTAVMKKIGAPQSEIDYLATQDGSHFDLDGDGEYTQKDYEARTW